MCTARNVTIQPYLSIFGCGNLSMDLVDGVVVVVAAAVVYMRTLEMLVLLAGALAVWWLYRASTNTTPAGLRGATALVTGGSYGIGFEIAKHLVRDGYSVVGWKEWC